MAKVKWSVGLEKESFLQSEQGQAFLKKFSHKGTHVYFNVRLALIKFEHSGDEKALLEDLKPMRKQHAFKHLESIKFFHSYFKNSIYKCLEGGLK